MDKKLLKQLLYGLWLHRKALGEVEDPEVMDYLRGQITSIGNELYNLNTPSVLQEKVIKMAIDGADFMSNIPEILQSIDPSKKSNLKKGSIKMTYINELWKSDKTGKVQLLEYQGIDKDWEHWTVRELETNEIRSYAFYIPGRIKAREAV